MKLNISNEHFNLLIESNKKVREYLQNHDVITILPCANPECNAPANFMNWKDANGRILRCRHCRKSLSPFKNTFFDNTKPSLQVILSIARLWLSRTTVSSASDLIEGDVTRQNDLWPSFMLALANVRYLPDVVRPAAVLDARDDDEFGANVIAV